MGRGWCSLEGLEEKRCSQRLLFLDGDGCNMFQSFDILLTVHLSIIYFSLFPT